MKTRSIFRILVLLVVLLTFNSRDAFPRSPPTKPGVRQNPSEVSRNQRGILLIGNHQGIDEADVQSVALLVVKQLHKHGIDVGDPVSEISILGTVYRIVLRRSDEKILFRLSEENTDGTIIVEREMLLEDIENVASAVPRLVYKFIHREPIIPSSPLVNVRFFTAIVPVKKVLAPGGGIGLHIDRLSYALEMEGGYAYMKTAFRPTGRGDDSEKSTDFLFWALSFGGRYFFSKQNISPYIGGGFAVTFARYTTTTKTKASGFFESFFSALSGADGWTYSRDPEKAGGVGAYGVLGMEFRRFSRSRLKFELRVNRSFSKLLTQDVMPITLGITGCWLF